MTTQSSFFNQKLRYGRKLIKGASCLNFKNTVAGRAENLNEWNRALDYCEKWVRYFDDRTRMEALIAECRKGKTQCLSMTEWAEGEARLKYKQRKEVKKTYRALGLPTS